MLTIFLVYNTQKTIKAILSFVFSETTTFRRPLRISFLSVSSAPNPSGHTPCSIAVGSPPSVTCLQTGFSPRPESDPARPDASGPHASPGEVSVTPVAPSPGSGRSPPGPGIRPDLFVYIRSRGIFWAGRTGEAARIEAHNNNAQIPRPPRSKALRTPPSLRG